MKTTYDPKIHNEEYNKYLEREKVKKAERFIYIMDISKKMTKKEALYDYMQKYNASMTSFYLLIQGRGIEFKQ